MSRVRRCLVAKFTRASEDVADLTAAIAVEKDQSLYRARDAAQAWLTEAVASLRDFDERHPDPENTPVRTVSQMLRAQSAPDAFRNAGDIASGKKV